MSPTLIKKFSKYDTKRKIKKAPYDILTSEDLYLDVRNIQNNELSPYCIIVDLRLFFWKNKISNSAFS